MPRNELIALLATVRTDLPKEIVARGDQETRFMEIVDATLSWQKFATDAQKDLILLENSDYTNELELEFNQKHNLNIRVLSVPRSKNARVQGISIGELEMMRHLDQVLDLEMYDFIWKAPGRNFVLNASKVYKWNRTSDMVFARNWRPQHFLNTRTFGMRPRLWRKMVSSDISFTMDFNSVSTSVFQSMEHFLTQFVLDQEARGMTQTDFSQIPNFAGFSGSTGKIIDSKKRRFALQFVNRIRPFLVKMLLGNTP